MTTDDVPPPAADDGLTPLDAIDPFEVLELLKLLETPETLDLIDESVELIDDSDETLDELGGEEEGELEALDDEVELEALDDEGELEETDDEEVKHFAAQSASESEHPAWGLQTFFPFRGTQQ